MTIAFACPRCQAQLVFQDHQAGASGPCYACGNTVVVPAPMAHAPSPSMAPMGAPMAPMPMPSPSVMPGALPPRPLALVPTPSSALPPGPSMPMPTTGGLPQVAPTEWQQKTLDIVAREAAKAGLTTIGTKVLQLGEDVSQGESMGAALRASFLFGGNIRIDRVQSIALRSPGGDVVLVVIPWSRAMRLAHEMMSFVPGTLPSCLLLSRGLLGAWSTGQWQGTRGGEEDPLAKQADRDGSTLTDGIQWDWESGRLRIKLDWGCQVAPFAADRSLLVMHTAEQGVVFRDFAIRWYLDRRLAWTKWIAQHAGPSARQEWNPAPLSILFLEDLVGLTAMK